MTGSKCRIKASMLPETGGWAGHNRVVATPTVPGPARQVVQALVDDLQALLHLLHPHQVAAVAVTAQGADHLEIEVLVRQVRLILAQVAHHAAGPRHRPRAAPVDRLLLGQDADPAGPVDED